MQCKYLGEVVADEPVDALLDVAEVVVLGNGVEHDGGVDVDVTQVVDTHADEDADAQLVGTLEQRSYSLTRDLDLGCVDECQHSADHVHRKLAHVDRYHFTCQTQDSF